MKKQTKQKPSPRIQEVQAVELVKEALTVIDTKVAPQQQDRLALMTPAELQKQVKIETEKRKIITDFIKQHMIEGVDFGKIHMFKNCADKKSCKIKGHWSKDTLFKPGAEKFCSLFRYKAEYTKDADTWEMLGSIPGTIALICKLYTSGSNILVGEGRGICSVKEKDGNANVAVKIAEKRAKINSVLQTGGLSDFFTQDLEDMGKESETIENVLVWSEKTRLEAIKFGKNKGTTWDKVDLNYLEWINAKMDKDEIVAFARAELNFRTPKHAQAKQTQNKKPENGLTWSEETRLTTINFGKFKGAKWSLLSNEYLKWLSGESKDLEVVDFAQKELNFRLNIKINEASLLTKSQTIQILRLIEEKEIPKENNKDIIDNLTKFSEKRAKDCIDWLNKKAAKVVA